MIYLFTVLIGEAYSTSCYVCSDESCFDPYEGLEDHIIDYEYFEMNGTTGSLDMMVSAVKAKSSRR